MALGFASALAAELLDAAFNSDAYDGPANVYMKLHIGDPGAAGTSNAAANTTRDEVSFAVASGGTITSDADTQWTNVPNSEDYTHASLHDHVSAGNFMMSGTITANAVVAGDTFTVPTGDVDIALSVAA